MNVLWTCSRQRGGDVLTYVQLLLFIRQACRRTHEKAAQRWQVMSLIIKASFLSMTLVDSSIDALITGKYIIYHEERVEDIIDT
jgi:hypothetical protein